MCSLKTLITLILALSTLVAFGQNIGINEDGSNPDASAILDIKSNDKGLLTPRLTTAQRTSIAAPATGLIVYDTTTSGFWYYDGTAWVEIASGVLSGNTLDGAYDEGGAGAGRIITADGGVVSVQGTDGIEVSGTFDSGATIGSPGAGTRMFFNPRKAAFRAGNVTGSEWDDANVGDYSIAMGFSTEASGLASFTAGVLSSASGYAATAFGQQTIAPGIYSVAHGYRTYGEAMNVAVFGRFNVGGGNPTSWVATDPLFEVGNGYGSSSFQRNNAFTILKNGNVGITTATPSATLDVEGTFQLVDGTEAAGRVLTSDAAGNATWADPGASGGTLDEAYDFGGPGAGRTINAEDGAVSINKNSSASGTALEISVNSTYNLNGRSAINTTNALTGLETYTNINGNPGPPYGKAFFITNYGSASITGKIGVAVELNQASTANYVGENRGFLYDVTYNGGSAGSLYGYQANIEGSGGAVKYGAHITIPSSSGGVHYGIYSDVQNASGYAAYFLGRTSLGAGTSNRYLMPATDGTAGQVMTTDGAGNVSWAVPASGGGSLDDAYDDGGAGNGRSITADAGAVSVQGTDGFEVTGTLNSGATIGNPGAGTRMLFNPRKAAFRAGRVSGNQWDDANVGTGSAAFGLNNTVSGSYSVAFGNTNQVISPFSVAMGENCQAQGAFSVAMGGSATAIGESAIAIGEASTANGDLSVAFSEGTANGGSSIAHGRGIIADGNYEFATGEFNTLYTPDGTLNDRAFVIGNGTGSAARSNALILQKNGLMTINDEFTLPNMDGNAGEIMATDGAGTVSWTGPVAFAAYQSADIASSSASVFPVDTEEFDTGNNFDPATATFTVPADGIYQFNFVEFSDLTSGLIATLQVRLNGTVNRRSVFKSTGTLNHRYVFMMELLAGDQVQFDHSGFNRTMYGTAGSGERCAIEGFLVR